MRLKKNKEIDKILSATCFHAAIFLKFSEGNP